MFARFFIDRPVFAMVLSILIVLCGSAAIWVLPIEQMKVRRKPDLREPGIHEPWDRDADPVQSAPETGRDAATNLLEFIEQIGVAVRSGEADRIMLRVPAVQSRRHHRAASGIDHDADHAGRPGRKLEQTDRAADPVLAVFGTITFLQQASPEQ